MIHIHIKIEQQPGMPFSEAKVTNEKDNPTEQELRAMKLVYDNLVAGVKKLNESGRGVAGQLAEGENYEGSKIGFKNLVEQLINRRN